MFEHMLDYMTVDGPRLSTIYLDLRKGAGRLGNLARVDAFPLVYFDRLDILKASTAPPKPVLDSDDKQPNSRLPFPSPLPDQPPEGVPSKRSRDDGETAG